MLTRLALLNPMLMRHCANVPVAREHLRAPCRGRPLPLTDEVGRATPKLFAQVITPNDGYRQRLHRHVHCRVR